MYIIGAYVHNNNQVEWKSIKNEIKAIHSLYLNPKIIVAGDLNDSYRKMEKLANKISMNSSNFKFTRSIKVGDCIQESTLDGIWSTEEITHQEQQKIPFTDHFLLRVDIHSHTLTQLFVGSEKVRMRRDIKEAIGRIPNFSICENYSSIIKREVPTKICSQ